MVSKMSGSLLKEFELIEKIFAPLARNAPGAFALTDDAATISLAPDLELVITTDALVEGVHFFRDDPAELVAKKALRVNLSDLAAKGATPQGYLLALSLAPWVEMDWLEAFARGLAVDQGIFGLSLLGGDTTATPGPLTLAITALGSVPRGAMILRSGARPGDAVFVTGTIGDAGAGLAALQGEGKGEGGLRALERDALIARYRLPEPRVALGPALLGTASASVDVSDGLLADLGHIADVSGVAIVVDATRVPVSAACKSLWGANNRAVARAATSGDDYEIAFTAPMASRAELAAAGRQTGIAVHEIGSVEEGGGVRLVDGKGQTIEIEKAGYTHF